MADQSADQSNVANSSAPREETRSKNKTFSMASPAAYLSEYANALNTTVNAVRPENLQAAIDLLQSTIQKGKRVYVCGNGGSAAIADHLCCDWTKGAHVAGLPALKTHSLTANGALLTALANDYSFEETFSTQVGYFGEAGDVLVAISSSGNSPNIIKGAIAARERGMKVIGLSGFSGGQLVQFSDISLYTPFDNYGLVEDCHQMLMHVISQFLVRLLEKKA